MPHCSRDLELTGTASSFIPVGTRRRVGWCAESLFRGKRSRQAARAQRGGAEVRGPGGSRAAAPSSSPPLRVGRTSASCGSPHRKDRYAKRVSFNFACKKQTKKKKRKKERKKNHLHIFCMSLTVSGEPGPGRGSGARPARDPGTRGRARRRSARAQAPGPAEGKVAAPGPAPGRFPRASSRRAARPRVLEGGVAGAAPGPGLGSARPGGAVSSSSALLFGGLEFFLTACCLFRILFVF